MKKTNDDKRIIDLLKYYTIMSIYKYVTSFLIIKILKVYLLTLPHDKLTMIKSEKKIT